MDTINVAVSKGIYQIKIAPGRLDHLCESVPEDVSGIVLVTSDTVGNLYGNQAEASLNRATIPVHRIQLPDGEIYKNLEILNRIIDFLLSNKIDRRGLLVAMGGGVIGDITGFAASIYLRGIRFIQVPTTLLAQVDSSIGGKTSINHILGKNMIGAFHHPISVEVDLEVLKTLDSREISSGLAEVIKYGLGIDRRFLNWCEENVASMRNIELSSIGFMIKRSCEIKAYVVEQDEYESGKRSILNLGHTFGHAIELGFGYGNWLHGEAVACGLVQAAELSADILDFPREDVERVRALVNAIGCPTDIPDFSTESWINLMRLDKKNENGFLRFILMREIGNAFIQHVSNDELSKTLSRLLKNKR